MQLQQIELGQVGTFSRPVRVDGIRPGLNVLAGANELGKSTILRALSALFLEAHRSAKQSIRELRPYAGGAPHVSCRFELGGAQWLLEKQYLSAHRALLQGGQAGESFQGADAENRLGRLLGEAGDLQSSLPLLWVPQGEAFDVPKPSGAARQTIGQVLASQAETTAGIGAAQGVLEAVEAELGLLVTSTGRVKKGGAMDRLQREAAELVDALAGARQREMDAEARVAHLAELQTLERELTDPQTAEAIGEQIAEHEARMRTAHDARGKLKHLNERIAFLESQKAQRAATLLRHDEDVAALHALAAEMTAADGTLAALAVSMQTLDGTLASHAERIEVLAGQERDLAGKLNVARKFSEAAGQRARLATLIDQKARLDALKREIESVDAALAEFNWPEGTFEAVRTTSARLEQLQARLEAGAPRLRVRYLPGRSSGLRIDGTDLEDAAELIIGAPTTLEIEAVGAVEITPAGGDASAVLEEERATYADALVDGLAAMGAADLPNAEVRAAARQELTQQRALLTAEYRALAPDGQDEIAGEIEMLRSAVGDDAAASVERGSRDDASAGSIEQLDRALTDVVQQKTAALQAREAARDERSALDMQRAGLAGQLVQSRSRRDELERQFAQSDGAAALRVTLAGHVETTEAELNQAARERIAVREVALSDEVLAELEQRLAALGAQRQGRGERLATVREEMRLTEGMLARDFEDGPGERVADLEARLRETEKRLAATQTRVAALGMLSEELDRQATRRRNEISKPLGDRLQVLAGHVWPESQLSLTAELGVDGLVRGGQVELPSAVSAGTREQVAVLARLAYAGMIADGAEAVPLILDDPLVFSDDNRLGALFHALADAARFHQIVILTCHARAFEPLISDFGATRLSVVEAG